MFQSLEQTLAHDGCYWVFPGYPKSKEFAAGSTGERTHGGFHLRLDHIPALLPSSETALRWISKRLTAEMSFTPCNINIYILLYSFVSSPNSLP